MSSALCIKQGHTKGISGADTGVPCLWTSMTSSSILVSVQIAQLLPFLSSQNTLAWGIKGT